MPSLSRLHSLRDVASMLGMDGPHAVRSVRRLLLRLEAKTGRQFLVRSGSTLHVRYLVSLKALKKSVPDLFADHVEEETVQQSERALRVVLKAMTNRFDTLEEQSEEASERVGAALRGISELSKRVALLERRVHAR